MKVEINEQRTHAVIVKAYIWRHGKLLLLKRCISDEIYAGHWDTPGGHLHESESALDGLAREVREETGLLVQKARPISTWNHGSALGLSFLAEATGENVQLSKEHTTFEWVAPDALDHLKAAPNLIREIRWLISKNWHR